MMTSRELVAATIRGSNPGRTPLYGWVSANLSDPITKQFGSVEAFEDHYAFDLAHIFGGPSPYNGKQLDALRAQGTEITPAVLLELPLRDPNLSESYDSVRKSLAHHKQRGRFCYMQTNGIFECLNGPFGIENHLMYMALYPDELMEVYRRQAEWNTRAMEHFVELGVDMLHVSDDWGAQNSLMFSLDMWRDMIFPFHKQLTEQAKRLGVFVSLHSDGCIMPALDGVVELGYDVVHPWQETAGMSYDVYLRQYQNKFAILGGLCIQSTLGFGDYKRLDAEIRRVFSLLKGKRFLFCTTHFVQAHCSMEELCYAYDLACALARG